MEAFTASSALPVLLTADTVLANAIPAQLRHVTGNSCTVVADETAFAALLRASTPPVVLLDLRAVQQPDILLRQLRQEHPLMAVLAMGSAAMAESCDPMPLTRFLRLPLAMPVLLRSIEQLMHARSLSADQQKLLLPHSLLFCPSGKRVMHGDAVQELTDKEVALLLCLYHHRHNWLPRQQLLEEVWGYGDAISTHTLETHLYRLRSKLRELCPGGEVIITRQGAYRLTPP